MEVRYRKAFLKDLRKLQAQPMYNRIYEMAFTVLPEAETLINVAGVKAMKGYPNRYRIRLGSYRIGVEVHDDYVEIVRALHRREFYRYFP